MEIKAKLSTAPDRVFTANFDMPETLAAMVEVLGEDVVISRAKASLVIDIQAGMRRLMEKGKTEEEVQAWVAGWKPEVREVGPRLSPFEKAMASVGKLTPEQREELRRQLEAA